jgi:hypothetical protein
MSMRVATACDPVTLTAPDTVPSSGTPGQASLVLVVAPLALVIAMVLLAISGAVEKAKIAAAIR